MPMDIEWTLAGGDFAIVQARPITALPEPVGEVPADWSVPDPTSLYYRASIVEQLPNPLSPLFATMAPGPISQTLLDIMSEVGLEFGDSLGFTTINGYGYVHMQIPARLWVDLLLKSPTFVPLFRDVVRRLREEYRPRYEQPVEAWSSRSLQSLTASELLAGAKEMLYRGVQYYTGVQTVIPLAVTSEVTFTQFYNRLVKRRWRSAGPDLPAGIRQRAHTCREIALRSRYLVPRASGSRCCAHRGAVRPGKRPACRGGAAGWRGGGSVAGVATSLPGPPGPVWAHAVRPGLR